MDYMLLLLRKGCMDYTDYQQPLPRKG